MRSFASRFVSFPLLLLLLGLPATGPLQATTIRQLSTEELILDAELILTGTCVEVNTTRLRGQLMTLATIDVEESFKGQPSSEVTVVLPGGIDTSRPVPVQVVYPGQPRLVHGDDVMLFLRPFESGSDLTAIVGFSQGAFRVFTDGMGQRVLRRDLTGLRLASGSHVDTGGVDTVSFAEITDLIREITSLGADR